MRKFKVTIQFNIENKRVLKTLQTDFAGNHFDENGVVELWYTSHGSKRSSNETAIRGMKEYLRFWDAFKRNYKILGAREIVG